MVDQNGSISINQSLDVAVPVKESGFMIRDKDWERIKRRLQAAKQKRKELSSAGWASLGLVGGSVLGGIAWEPAYRSMATELRPEFAWIWPTLIAIDIGGVLVAAAMFWTSHVTRAAEAASIDEVLEDMAEIRAGTET